MNKVVVIAGPTASGKSALALQLAKKFSGEIISGDSMQWYRELSIGVAKPTAAELAQVPHHLIGILPLTAPADVHLFCRLAAAKIAEITARGNVPFLVGGTGFYLKSLLYGIDELPGDDALRKQLDAKYDSEAAFPALKAKMAELDPAALAQFASCRRKLIRALEVKMLCGQSILSLQSGANRTLRYAVFGRYLDWDREVLKQRIYQRVCQMLADGWQNEAETAISHGLLSSPTARQAIGYKLIGEALQGKITQSELPQRLSIATWQFARRQITWFKHQAPECLSLAMPCRLATVSRQLADFLDNQMC